MEMMQDHAFRFVPLGLLFPSINIISVLVVFITSASSQLHSCCWTEQFSKVYRDAVSETGVTGQR